MKYAIYSLILSLVLASSGALASNSCQQVFLGEEYLLTRIVEKSLFVKSRDIYDYRHELHKDFGASLQKLRSDQHWIDMGAGRALAEYDYLKSFKDPRQGAFVTAVAFKINRWFGLSSFKGKLQSQEGLFELMETSNWRKADLITDLYGVYSYTKEVHSSLQKMVDLLNVQGELYITTINFDTSFHLQDGRSVDLRDFLSSIPGLRVEDQWLHSIKVTKLQEQIKIPAMKLIYFEESSPPKRSYQVLP
ncbi:hypothetical protein D3C72_1258770 [compost metagenome]